MVHGQSQARLEGEPCSPDAQLGSLFLFSQENEPTGTLLLGLKAFLGCFGSKPILGATSKDLSLIIQVFHSMLRLGRPSSPRNLKPCWAPSPSAGFALSALPCCLFVPLSVRGQAQEATGTLPWSSPWTAQPPPRCTNSPIPEVTSVNHIIGPPKGATCIRTHIPSQLQIHSCSDQNSMILAQKQTYRSMGQDRKSRDKPTHLWSPNL